MDDYYIGKMKKYLATFDPDYKKAFAKQQGVSDATIANKTEEELDDYLIQNIIICPQYEHPFVHDRNKTFFLHRANTYPKRRANTYPNSRFCHTCNLKIDRDYNQGFHGHPEAKIVTRHAGEGIEPMTPENYQRYDQILRQERKEAREEREREREREREEIAKREQEEKRRLEREREERAKFEAVGKIGSETLEKGYCPIMLDYVDELDISKLCGHGISPEAREKLETSNCPICRQENAFATGNAETLLTKQGKEKKVAAVKAKHARKAAAERAIKAAVEAGPTYARRKRDRAEDAYARGKRGRAEDADAKASGPEEESKPVGKSSGLFSTLRRRLGYEGGKKTRRRQNKKMTRKSKSKCVRSKCVRTKCVRTKRTRTKVNKHRTNKTRRK